MVLILQIIKYCIIKDVREPKYNHATFPTPPLIFATHKLSVIDRNFSIYNLIQNPNVKGATHTYDISGISIGQKVRVRFVKTSNSLSSASMMANLGSQVEVNDIDKRDFYHKKPTQLATYDLDAMWDVRNTQIVNLEKTDASQTTLYVTVFRFDPDYRLNFPVGYDIYITSSSGFLC